MIQTLFGTKFESYLNQTGKPLNRSDIEKTKSQAEIEAEIKDKLS